jgi:hypothetical protein
MSTSRVDRSIMGVCHLFHAMGVTNPLAMLEIVLDLHGGRSADKGEAVDHGRDHLG